MVGTPVSMSRWAACTVSLVCIAASTTLAQVTIREKVELTGNAVSKRMAIMETPNPAPYCRPVQGAPDLCNYVIVDTTGILYMYGMAVLHLDGFQSQNNMKVTIIRGDSSWTVSKPMESKMEAGTTTQVLCREEEEGPVVQTYTRFEHVPLSHWEDSLSFGRVAPGDTVVAYYVYGGTDLPIELDNPDAWYLDDETFQYSFWFTGLQGPGSSIGPGACQGLIGEINSSHAVGASHAIFTEAARFEIELSHYEYVDNVAGTGDSMYVLIDGKEADERAAPVPVVNISLDSIAAAYGHLLGPGGTQGSGLLNVDPDSLGTIRYVATDAPASPAEGKVIVEKTGDDTINGEGSFWLTDSALVASADPNPVAFEDTSFVTVTVWDRDQPEFDGENTEIQFYWTGAHNGKLLLLESSGGPWSVVDSAGFTGLFGVPYAAVDPSYVPPGGGGSTTQRVAFVSDTAGADPNPTTSLEVYRDLTNRWTTLDIEILGVVITIEEDSTWLPMADSTLEYSVRFPPNVTAIRVEVANHDYGDGLTYITLPGDKETANYRVSGGTFSANLVSHQYWGIATLIATIIGPVSSGLVGFADTVQFPVDVDADGMSDVWERAHGFLSMTSSSDNCGLPGVVCQDSAWDGETYPAADSLGDTFSKIEEYQGVLIGGLFHRLSPGVKELFLDLQYVDAARDSLVMSKLAGLGFAAYRVEGIDDVDAQWEFGEYFPGSASLDWLRPNISNPFQGYRRFTLSSYGRHVTPINDVQELENGLIIRDGVFYWGDIPWDDPSCPDQLGCFGHLKLLQAGEVSSDDDEPPAPLLGITSLTKYCTLESYVFLPTINAYFDVAINSIPEDAGLKYPISVSKGGGPLMVADFPNDFTQDGDSTDLVNQFDVADYDGFDPAFDNLSLTLTYDDAVTRVLLHELGHSLGIRGEKATKPSPMINKLGPFQTTDYDSEQDVPRMILKWNDPKCPK